MSCGRDKYRYESSRSSDIYKICLDCDSCQLLRLIIESGALNTDVLPEFIALSDDEEIENPHHNDNLKRQQSASFSDNSESGQVSEKKKRKCTNSPPNFDDDNEEEEEDDVIYMGEENPLGSDFTLDGCYYCKYCKVSMNSKATFLCHLSGKRHQKALKLKNAAETVSKSIPDSKVESRYPLPPRGVYRMKTKDIALIQQVVERSIKPPVVGLDKVIEIQGLNETSYYCELCDAPCSTITILPHLKGQKHQIQCLRYFKPEIYEKLRYKRKDEVELKVLRIMKYLEKKYGCGKLSVEKEFKGKREASTSHNMRSTHSRRAKTFSQGLSYYDQRDFQEFYSRSMIPDTSKSDFYCKICDSHMNNLNMWEAHIRGKRHITNSKKPPGEEPSKTKTILVPGARAELMNKLDKVKAPVVGLDEMRETQNPETAGNLYNCFMCGACVTSLDVVEHILSQKHRTKYLELIKHPDMETLNHFNIQESRLYSLIEETCCKVEEERGRGYLEVHVVKSAITKR